MRKARHKQAWLSVWLLAVTVASAGQSGHRAIVVRGPTVIAFFAPVTTAQLNKNADLNDAYSDFLLYASQARDRFKKRGIAFHQTVGQSFRVQDGQAITTFSTRNSAGYYLVAPGRKPEIHHGVMTDDDLLTVARSYFSK